MAIETFDQWFERTHPTDTSAVRLAIRAMKQAGWEAEIERLTCERDMARDQASAALVEVAETLELVQPNVGGKPFRCGCGGNVFRAAPPGGGRRHAPLHLQRVRRRVRGNAGEGELM